MSRKSIWLVSVVMTVLAVAAVQVPAAAKSPAPDATAASRIDTQSPAEGTVEPMSSGGATARFPGEIPVALPPRLPVRVTNVMSEGIMHFPLQVGNQWVYEKRYPNGYETTWQVAVTGYSEGGPYPFLNEEPPPDLPVPAGTGALVRGFALEGYFGGVAVVNYGSGGELVELVPDGRALLWYRLGASVGASWNPEVYGRTDPCIDRGSAVIASIGELVRVPAGAFADTVRGDYQPDCMDAGLVSEWFVAGVGLVKRLETSVAGPIESVLLSSRVGGNLLPDHPAATSLTLDRSRVLVDRDPSSATLKGAFRVHEQTTDAERFEFQGCVSASVTLVNDTGQPLIETRLDDGGCCECKNLVILDLHGETLTFPLSLDLLDASGHPLPEGHYSLTITLDSLDAKAVRPSATTHFHVEEVR